MNDIEYRLKSLRESKNLTQKQVADYLHLDSSRISKLECGSSPLNISLIISLCDLYGCSADYMLCRSGDKVTDSNRKRNLLEEFAKQLEKGLFPVFDAVFYICEVLLKMDKEDWISADESIEEIRTILDKMALYKIGERKPITHRMRYEDAVEKLINVLVDDKDE